MKSAVTASEIVSVLFLCVILWGLLAPRGKKSLSAKLYLVSVIAAVFGTAMDAVSYLMEGTTVPDGVQWIVTIFALAGCDLLMVPFVYYAWSLVQEKEPTSPWYAHMVAIACSADFFFILVTSLLGENFTIKNGVFTPGPMYDYNGVLQIVMLFWFFIVILYKRKALGKKGVLTIGTYFVLPTIAALLQWTVMEESLVYVSVALVMSIVYVSLQAGEIEKGHLREKVMFEVSNTDSMTGLNNRRAYEARLTGVDPCAEACVMFCDLNGLKHANDTYGHKAGDELILRFADLLRKSFPLADIFRISGDEFVVIRQGMTEEMFQARIDQLRQRVKENDDIAALGATCGSGSEIMSLITYAEKEMYADKNGYYKKRGIRRVYAEN